MTPEQLEQITKIPAYAPACLIPGYDDYCPIVHLRGHINNDTFTAETHWGEISIPKERLIYNAGYLVLHIGSVETEHTVETAANAVYESLFALFSACHDIVRYERIRTTVELSEYLKLYRCNYSHIILIGHGSENGIPFLDKPKPIRGSELSGLLGADSHKNPIQIISLCCHSGCEENARALSKAEGVKEVLAPSDTFDLRWSVHFILGYFLFFRTGIFH